LRKATIAQFTRIATAIGEDELIGFGLYQSDQEGEPTEWRCLSRRTASRIFEEIQLLGAAAGLNEETHLPSIIDSGVGARLFRDRRDRRTLESEQSKWPRFVRDVEANLARRLDRLEGEVESHSHQIRDLRETSAATEESFRALLTSVENFCGQATRQLEKLTPALAPSAAEPKPAALESSAAASPELAPPPPVPVAAEEPPVKPASVATLETAAPQPVPVAAEETPVARAPFGALETKAASAAKNAPVAAPERPAQTTGAPLRNQRPPQSSEMPWRALGVAASIVLGIAAATFFWLTRTPEPRSAQAAGGTPPAAVEIAKPVESGPADRAAERAVAEPPAAVVAKPDAEHGSVTREAHAAKSEPSAAASEPTSDVMRVELEARDLVWVTVTDADGKTLIARTLQPNETRTLELTKDAVLRTGNAGGLVVRFNGQDVGPLGPSGKIRDVHFKGGTYKIVAVRDAG
jgi:hypothetical protein